MVNRAGSHRAKLLGLETVAQAATGTGTGDWVYGAAVISTWPNVISLLFLYHIEIEGRIQRLHF